MQLSATAIDHILETWPVARLASVAPDGRPHQVPIVFARSEGALWSPVDAKPKRGPELVRLRNVRRDPRVSLLLDAYGDDWSRLWWLRLDGDASVIEPRDPEDHPAARALRAKYPQYLEVDLFRDPPTLLRITVASARSWCGAAAQSH